MDKFVPTRGEVVVETIFNDMSTGNIKSVITRSLTGVYYQYTKEGKDFIKTHKGETPLTLKEIKH